MEFLAVPGHDGQREERGGERGQWGQREGEGVLCVPDEGDAEEEEHRQRGVEQRQRKQLQAGRCISARSNDKRST